MLTKRSCLVAAKHLLCNFFYWQAQQVWLLAELALILDEMRHEWRLPTAVSLADLVHFLEAEQILIRVDFPILSQHYTRYCTNEATPYQLALSLRPGSFFSHQTALYFHGLTCNAPETVYVNKEQKGTGKNSDGKLTQGAIHTAFSKPPRTSRSITSYNGVSLCLLSAKNTQNLRIVKRYHPRHGNVRFTDLERTLVESAVRPFYSGGALGVLCGYRLAAPRISPEALLSTLLELDYTYPYHQSIGFYLERSGCFSPGALECFRSPGLNYGFYLEHQIEEPAYSDTWRVYYPRELDIPPDALNQDAS